MNASALARALAASLALAVVPTQLGCAALPRTRRIEHARSADSCARVPRSVRAGLPDGSEGAELEGTPADIRRIARAAGLHGFEPEHRAANFERLVLLVSEVNAAASEIDCLADHVEDLEGELRSREQSYELGMTLGSIAWGALASVVAGIVSLESRDDLLTASIEIGGGVGSALLGALAFFPPSETITLDHSRNVLRAIQRGAEDATLPGFVVRLMDEPHEDLPGDRPGENVSRRSLLLGAWREALDASGGEAMGTLLFGDGGLYDIDALRVRELLLELLETEVQLESQDLEVLFRYVAATARDE